MPNQLIPVFSGAIANDSALLCNARDLHAFLQIGKRFASWITERINDYGFTEGEDYILISQNRETKQRGGDRRSKDYHLTLDMAKELAMVERNEQGRAVRRYFIECERELLDRCPSPDKFQFVATVERGVITGIEVLHPGEHIVKFDEVKEIAERAGWLMIHSDQRPDLTLSNLINYLRQVHNQAIYS